ncbi:MAG: chromosome segregation protein SMC [Clostridia bacterium]|nr:chromosome segregation protein SMC [Clostridia bacterium]
MRLKSIEMQGFKSFADKIYLDFNSGITAIVGPNGSGKSNISDAIRWVMGEQSVKSLRGSRMEDVIFAGTEARKALGFAEVTLTLDNTDGYFPLEFPEVSVTRRVYRSGEGEYYINKTLCRLKDIHELFMDTGLGRDGYSIIGQGKIDSIISTKSEDRRQIFEEAAGISKYKYRKIEAERKLVQTVENLTRVQDILSELEGQLEPLHRQSEKAKKYLVLRDELRGLDINASVINIERIKSEQVKLDEDFDILNSQIAKIAAELAETDAVISHMYDSMRKCDGEIENVNERERSVSVEISENEKNIGILQNDTEHNLMNIERLEIEIKHISEGIELADKELKAHRDRLEGLNEENLRNTAEIDEFTAVLAKAGENVGEKSEALEALKGEIIDITASLNALRSSVENMKILGDSFLKRKSDITAELDIKLKSREELASQFETARAKEREIREEVSEAEVEQRKAEGNLKNKKEEKEALTVKKNQHQIELGQKRSRRTMLMDMEREFEGYAKGVKSVMTAFNDGVFGKADIYGPLAQLIKTQEKYITAVETALGGAGQNIVTKTEEEAKTAIKYLKEKHLGRATFLPITAVKAKPFDNSSAEKCKGYIAVASELIDCEEIYREIVESFLGAVVVCDNIDNAVAMAKANKYKFKIVTLGGELLQPGGAITGGSAAKTTGSLSRMGEIDSLGKDIDKLKVQAEEEENKLTALAEEVKAAEAEISNNGEKIQQLRADLAQEAANRERCQALLENLDSSKVQIEKELSEILARLSEIDKDTADKNNKIQELTAKRLELEEEAAKSQEEYSRLTGENERLSVHLTELNIKRSTILKDIELENERISGINDSKAEQMESVNVKRGGIETLRERNRSIEEEIATLKESCSQKTDEVKALQNKVKELQEGRLKTEAEIRECQSEVKETQEQKFALTQKADKIDARREKLASDRENIINRMWEDYEITYSEALEMRIGGEFDFKAASLRIKELKDSIKGLGNINIDAIEEYKNVKERFDFLTVQTNDLQKAKTELDSVIAEMMEIMQTRFAEQFKVINENFSRVFGELFGGGRATLSLTEPDNVLESGIEIEAQPPGKKLQNLSLLSGGEKAFTAIALLFAILDVRPTPFCILDEIEAALDDVNVYRYADYLNKYSKKTQFIVVTHRRGTMESADILYGVTMQERGISKLLTLNIDEIKE